MSPEERDPAYLWDMLQAAGDVVEFTRGMTFEQFSADHRTRYAVERQLMVIGEAAGRVSKTFREQHHEIPWTRIVGQRNVLAHEYGEILVERIWLTVRESIPPLIEALQAVLPQEKTPGEPS